MNKLLDSTTDGVLRTGTQGLVDRLNRFSNNLNNLTLRVNVDPAAQGLVPNIV